MIYILLFIQFIIGLAAVVLMFYLAYILISFRDIIPFVPTPYKVVRKMIALADLREGQRVIDLGSGSGRIIFEIVKNHPVEVVGIEKLYPPYWVSKLLALFHHKKGRLKIVRADMFNYDFSSFDVVFCYLIPEAMERLKPTFEKMKPGSRVISHIFTLKDNSLFKERVEKVGRNKIYVYDKVR